MNLFEEINKQNDNYEPKVFVVWAGGKRVNKDSYLTYQEATALADECREEGYDEVDIEEVITFNQGENSMTTQTELQTQEPQNKLEIDDVYSIANDVYFEVIRYLGVYDECVVDDEDTGGTKNTEYGRDLYYLIEDTIKETINYKEEGEDDDDDE